MKAKRLVALLLALVMIVGLFAMTASAYQDTCGACDFLYNNSTINMYNDYGPWTKASSSGRRVEGCGKRSGIHEHFVATRRVADLCKVHGLIGNYYTQTDYDHCFG